MNNLKARFIRKVPAPLLALLYHFQDRMAVYIYNVCIAVAGVHFHQWIVAVAVSMHQHRRLETIHKTQQRLEPPVRHVAIILYSSGWSVGDENIEISPGAKLLL